MAKLIFILDDEQEIEVPLPQQVTVGRQEGNDVVVDDPRISARHAVVVRDRNGNYEVRDLGSKAGTYINGVRQERRLLHPGDKLSFGPLKCIFLMEETERPVNRQRPAGSVAHPVLTGILESTSVRPHAEQDGPRLTGNAFASGAGEGKAPSPVPGNSGMVVTPRLMQPHSSVTSPRSPYDEPLDKKAAGGPGKPPSSKGTGGVLKSFLRSVGAIRHEEHEPAEEQIRNTVSPRQAPPSRDDERAGSQPVVRPVSGDQTGHLSHHHQQQPTHLTQRGATQGRETSSGVKPLAGINKGPQPRDAGHGTAGQGASQSELIERVPVYTYAVQPKARPGAPQDEDTRRREDEALSAPVPSQEIPRPTQLLVPPAQSYYPQQPLPPQPLSPAPGQAVPPSSLSPLPPMPAGMVRPPLPPLPALPATMKQGLPELPLTPVLPSTGLNSPGSSTISPGQSPGALPTTGRAAGGGFKVRISPSTGTGGSFAAPTPLPSPGPLESPLASTATPAPVAAPVPVPAAAPVQAEVRPVVAPPATVAPAPVEGKAKAPESPAPQPAVEPVSALQTPVEAETLAPVNLAPEPIEEPKPSPLPEAAVKPVVAEPVQTEEVRPEVAAKVEAEQEVKTVSESVVTALASAPEIEVSDAKSKPEVTHLVAPVIVAPKEESAPSDKVGSSGSTVADSSETLSPKAEPVIAERSESPVPALPTAPAESEAEVEAVEKAKPAEAKSEPASPQVVQAPTPVASVEIKTPAPAENLAPEGKSAAAAPAAPPQPEKASSPAPTLSASPVAAASLSSSAASLVPASVPVAEGTGKAAEVAPEVKPATATAGQGAEPTAAEQPPFPPSTMDADRAHVSQLVKDLEGKQSNLMQSLRALTDRKHATQAEMERMMNEVRRSVTELEGLKNQILARQEELRAIDRETESRHAHLTQLTAEQQRLAPMTTALQQAEVRHNELVVILHALVEQRQAREADLHRASEELQQRSEMVARLQAEEQRLAHVTAALMEGEGRYGEMVVALQALAEQHDVTHNHLKNATEEVRAKADRISQLSAQDEWYVQSISHRQAELSEAEQKLTQTLEAITQGVARHEELVRGLENLDIACGKRQLELQQLADASTASTQDLEAIRAKVQGTEDQLRDTDVRLRTTEATLRGIETDIQSKQQTLDSLGADEKRLQAELEALKERELAFQGAANDAEAKHAGWLTAIQGLGQQHDQKQTEIQRLHNASEGALRELEAMTANKEQMSVHLLSLLKEQEAIDSRLTHMRKQSDDAEARVASLKSLVEKREDEARERQQVLAELETKRKGFEERIEALTGTEEKLLAAKQLLKETEESQVRAGDELTEVSTRLQIGKAEAAELESRIGELQTRLESLHVEITESRAGLARDQKTHEDFQAVASEARSKQESYREALDKQLETLRADLAKESQKLAETMSQREELDRQCAELAETGTKLAETKASLQRSEAQKTELDSLNRALEGKRDSLEQIVGGLHGDEESTKGRLEVLRTREKDLRQVLDELADRERNERERFEALRRLTAEADKEHNEQRESLLAKLDGKRRELADLELKLTPLREWKECMDIRYARLASLPEDSDAARELWREIEGEKSNLRNLIVGSPGGTRGVSLSEAVLRGLTAPSLQSVASHDVPHTDEAVGALDGDESRKAGGLASRKGRFSSGAGGSSDEMTPEERGNVGQTGTGAMHSGTGQEMALKARLNRLRESVQREATRLEFLRQERAREELRTKGGSTGEPMLREQERQLETKIRREEEKFATVQRKLELAEVEEEKRRDRITEMERKLAELKSAIIDAERDRGAARHHAEIAQAEQKAQEENLKRLNDNPNVAPEETSVLAALIGGKKTRGPSNLKPMGTPKE